MNAAAVEQADLTKALSGSPFGEEILGWLRQAHEMLHAAPEKRLSQAGSGQ
jgi:hypothetical protein